MSPKGSGGAPNIPNPLRRMSADGGIAAAAAATAAEVVVGVAAVVLTVLCTLRSLEDELVVVGGTAAAADALEGMEAGGRLDEDFFLLDPPSDCFCFCWWL